ncbi:hypothetical protein HYE28_03895 [Mycoplasmopsis bovis]|nr:hypothetical protein [Mycoplasmopsis bovis]QQH23106.1 hypothetical protein HYE28_03895 [Mycoplasmopsis bovis]
MHDDPGSFDSAPANQIKVQAKDQGTSNQIKVQANRSRYKLIKQGAELNQDKVQN